MAFGLFAESTAFINCDHSEVWKPIFRVAPADNVTYDDKISQLHTGCNMSPTDGPPVADGTIGQLLRAAESVLSTTLLEAVPDAIVAVNQDGIILQVNSQAESLFGYSREELIGQPIEILVPAAQREPHRHHRISYTGKPRARRMGSGLDLRGRRRDASEFPVEISLSPVPTDRGIVVLSAIRDVSDRKHIEEELRRANEELGSRKDRQLWEYQNRLAAIVDSSHDAVIGKNLDGIITSWNKGAERIYGYKAEEVIGRPISLLAPAERQDEIPSILKNIRDGLAVEHFETVRVTKGRAPSERLDFGVSHS